MDLIRSYSNALVETIGTVLAQPAVYQGAQAIADSMLKGGLVYLFGTGHSASVAVEPYHRSGGLAPVFHLADPALSMMAPPAEATALERLEGVAQALLLNSDVTRGDVLVVISNSGINAVPVEMAMEGRRRGAKVIAIVSAQHSAAQSPRHASGLKLTDVADVVIDNCAPSGDALLRTDASPEPMGGVSTITGAAIVNAIMAQAAAIMAQAGVTPPVIVSSNTEHGDERGARWLEAYRRPDVMRKLLAELVGASSEQDPDTLD